MCMVHPSALHCTPMLLTCQKQETLVWILPVSDLLSPKKEPGCDILALPGAGAWVPPAALLGCQYSLRHS